MLFSKSKNNGVARAAKRFNEKLRENAKRPDCSVMTRQRRRREEITSDKSQWRKTRAAKVHFRKMKKKIAA